MGQAVSRGAERVPLQERGHRTRERILSATERLLRRKRLEDLTVQEIVQAARSSVGSFYHLFGTKDALVAPLYSRYDARLTERATDVLDPARWSSRTLAYRASRLFRYAARVYRHNRGLMRSLVLHARSHPEDVTPQQHRHRREFYDRVTDLFLERRREIAHPDPESAVRLGLFVVGAALRDKVLFGSAPHPRSVELDDRALAEELTRVFLAFLQLPERRRSRAID
jgi:AcrR family transcriptional regulator